MSIVVGRKHIKLTPLEINKINLLYHLNEWKLSNISKAIKRSVPVIDRNLFPTKDQWHEWAKQMESKGLL